MGVGAGSTRSRSHPRRASRSRHERTGRPAAADPDDAETPAALLLSLPFWFFDCGRRSAARKATACADASGPRARELIPENAPLRVTGKTSRPNLALHGPYTGPYLCHQKANKNRWQQHEEKSAQ